ncbi:hypothetical protein PoB_004020400 [Plakobranchus ocellatus]|uniref:Uncharacterized protein n=1 Tax=Plakobranchus ocellatus TaxID=259542 RepID=A0AAV4B110_9GAST|nr:hypothetical protein PoB_004020400 [Plakobranchus ocellatus]
MSNVTVRLTPIASTAKETIQPAARPVRSFWKNKPFFATKLRMAVHFSKPVRQLLLNSIKRFQPELLLVPSNLSFERSQQRSPRMAAEVPLLPRPRGKKPRRILRLPVPREQQKPKNNFEELKLLLNRSQSAVVALQECKLGEGQLPPWGYTLLLPWGGSSGGEAALLIRNGTRFSEIDLKTDLHAAAATISLEKTLRL